MVEVTLVSQPVYTYLYKRNLICNLFLNCHNVTNISWVKYMVHGSNSDLFSHICMWSHQAQAPVQRFQPATAQTLLKTNATGRKVVLQAAVQYFQHVTPSTVQWKNATTDLTLPVFMLFFNKSSCRAQTLSMNLKQHSLGIDRRQYIAFLKRKSC